MIRFILAAAFLLSFLILSIPLLLVEGLLYLIRPRFHRRRIAFLWVTWGFRIVIRISGMHLTVLGAERIPRGEAVLYIGNHQSYFDIIISYGLMPDLTGFMSKIQMKKAPLLAQLMTCVNCLFLDRDDIRQGMETILTAIERIREGISIAIYPEGTRNSNPDELMEFHKGSFKIAQRTDCPIVPVTIVGSRNVFERQFPRIVKTRVVLEYGTPFRFSELSKENQKQIHTYTANIIRETYRKNKSATD